MIDLWFKQVLIGMINDKDLFEKFFQTHHPKFCPVSVCTNYNLPKKEVKLYHY
jgi:hypothetical protein